MKRVAFHIVLICVVLVVGCGQREPESVKIGVILPMTGGAASYGEALKNGIDLALKEVNERGILKNKRLQLIYEDDQGQPAAGVSAFQKLTSIDGVSVVIGGAMSSVASALAPLSREKKVVLLSPTATAPELSNAGTYFFRIWPSDTYDGKVMAHVAFDTLGLRKVAVLYVNADYGKGITDVFCKDFESLGGTVLSKESYMLGATDFRAQLSKIKAAKPEGLFLPGYYQEIAGILRQAAQLKLKTRLLGVNSFYEPKLLEIAGSSADGTVFSYPTYDINDPDTLVQNFVKAFRTQYNKDPNAFAVQGYDALRVVARAIDLSGGLASEQLAQRLSEVDYGGPGGRIRFLATGDVEKPFRLLTIRGGKFLPYADGARQ